MTAFLEMIGAFFTQIIEWMGELLTFITSKPELVVIVFGMFIVGSVFAYLRRLVRG